MKATLLIRVRYILEYASSLCCLFLMLFFSLPARAVADASPSVCIDPAGVHVWPNNTLDTLFVEAEVHNQTSHPSECRLNVNFESRNAHKTFMLGAYLSEVVLLKLPLRGIELRKWEIDHPQYHSLVCQLMLGYQQNLAQQIETPVGFTTVQWPDDPAASAPADGKGCFFFNGQPVWLNGVCELTRLSDLPYVRSADDCMRRVRLAKYMGFNLLCDLSDEPDSPCQTSVEAEGMLWYPQFYIREWTDQPASRTDLKKQLAQWVKTHRNSPAVIGWSLQSASPLPADFEQECLDLIRQLDPRTSRPVTLGTHPLLPLYGTTRTLGNPESEQQYCAVLNEEMARSWKNRQQQCGHLLDALTDYSTAHATATHRGILSPFWEPTDAYYLYVAWGDFLAHQRQGASLDSPGKTARQMVVYGYKAEDVPLPDYLEADDPAPVKYSYLSKTPDLRSESGRTCVFRLNCGGTELTDSYGQVWEADDVQEGKVNGEVLYQVESAKKPSWVAHKDQDLFRTYRWGRPELQYSRQVTANRVYLVDVYYVSARHRLQRYTYKTRVGSDGILNINFKNMKTGSQNISAIAVSTLL